MDKFNRTWIIENGVPIAQSYNGNLTVRGLYYRLVSLGMTNSIQHYKRVVAAMIKARWDGDLSFGAFRDLDRDTVGKTEYEATILEEKISDSKSYIDSWMNYYRKNRWENQPNYVEVFIEKKALQGVFEGPCEKLDEPFLHARDIPALPSYTTLVFAYKMRSMPVKMPLYFTSETMTRAVRTFREALNTPWIKWGLLLTSKGYSFSKIKFSIGVYLQLLQNPPIPEQRHGMDWDK